MSGLSVEERGDLAEALLPEAAGLVVDVHEGAPEEVEARLSRLGRHELEALAVVLAGIVDPDRSLKAALGWVTFDEYGERLFPSQTTRSVKAVRDLVREPRCRSRVDLVAVHRALTADGAGRPLTASERRLAVEIGVGRGFSHQLVADLLGVDVGVVKKAWWRVLERRRAGVVSAA
ncbi:hypothetical protein [Streptomyces sp. AD55]|uniref:hypothetical protein n=1 Tax=Streptomyces sp. AD55 TaxID=3242895 RepID=UPI0035271F64